MPDLLQDHGELELVVELLGQVLGVDHRVVLADQRVDVLEEDDPGRDLVIPVDLLALLLVLAEVAGGVEELLRHDRRQQPGLGERHAAAALLGPAALEVLAHRGHVEQRDLVADDMADGDAGLGVLERHKLHVVSPSCPQMRRAARA